MKLIGNLKKQVERTESKAEAKEVIKQAGMLLTDEELDNVAGGVGGDPVMPEATPQKDMCSAGQHNFVGAPGSRVCSFCGAPENAAQLKKHGWNK